MTREELAVFKEIERRTHRRIDGGAATEAGLWMSAPSQPKSVAAAIKVLARNKVLIVGGSKMLLARYRGWTRGEGVLRVPQPAPSLHSQRVKLLIRVMRENIKIAGLVSRFEPASIANEDDLAECILAALERKKLINPAPREGA